MATLPLPNDGISIDDRNTGAASSEVQVDDLGTGSTERFPTFNFSGTTTVMPAGLDDPEPLQPGDDVPMVDGSDSV